MNTNKCTDILLFQNTAPIDVEYKIFYLLTTLFRNKNSKLKFSRKRLKKNHVHKIFSLKNMWLLLFYWQNEGYLNENGLNISYIEFLTFTRAMWMKKFCRRDTELNSHKNYGQDISQPFSYTIYEWWEKCLCISQSSLTSVKQNRQVIEWREFL